MAGKILDSISMDQYKHDLIIPEGLLDYRDILLDSVRPFIDILPQPNDATEPWESKFGGVPYLPKECAYPLDSEGHPLSFLAQINLAETPRLEGFPTRGIVAFYIYSDYVESLTRDNTRQDRFRILYFEHVVHEDAALSTEFGSLPSSDGVPIKRPLALDFRMDYAPVSNEDYRFKELLGRRCYDIDPEMTFAEKMAFFKMRRHKMGGYCGTTQECPIAADSGRDVLLLQIGSDEHVEWGNGGLANFFMSPADLRKRDFSSVLYNWDTA